MNQYQVESLFDRLAEARQKWEAQSGLPFGYLPYLIKLSQFNDPVWVGDLATSVGCTQQAAGKMAKEMERESLIKRVRDRDDGRAKLLSLTQQGRAVLGAIKWNK